MIIRNFTFRVSIGVSCLLFSTFCLSYAQETKVIPPSPEASSLFKFSEVPVSLYSGLVNTTVELFQIGVKGLTIPIQVGYHSRGIQVGELSSSVGAGWALGFGGLISRQVRGGADDGGHSALNSFYYNDIFSDANKRASLMDGIVQGIDEIPDQFMLDMNGETSKFFFNPSDGQILKQKYADIKISHTRGTDGKIAAWIVVDKMGNTFYFGRSKNGSRSAVDEDWEVASYSYSSLTNQVSLILDNNESRNINSWRLMEIETPLHEKIEFFYEEEESSFYRKSFDSNVGNDYAVSNFSNILSHQQQIREIRFPNGKIKFVPMQMAREDLPGGYGLHKVSLYNNQEVLLKEHVFNYYYTTSPTDDNVLSYLNQIDPAAKKRMFLSSIQESSPSGVKPPTLFEYNATILPSRFSTSQDNWGYFNGKSNGSYLVFYNKDRTVDPVYAEAGLLKKITNPLGGVTEFTYEQNIRIPPAFIDQLIYPENNGSELVRESQGMIKAAMYYDGTVYTKPVNIGEEKQGPVNFNMMLPYCGGDNNFSYCDYSVTLSSATATYYLWPNGGISSLNIPPGEYTLTVMPDGSHDPNQVENLFIFELEWIEKRSTTGLPPSGGNPPWLGPGKRIRKITYSDGPKLGWIKEYDYSLSSGKTSGSILGLPNFYFLNTNVAGGTIPVFDKYGSLPGSPLTNLQGNGIGYSKVTEYFGSSQANYGKIEHEFTVHPDAGDYYTFPYHPPIDNEWLRGMLLSKKVFEKDATEYVLKKSIVNTYRYADTPQPWNLMTPFVPEVPGYAYEISRRRFFVPLLIFIPDPNDEMSYSFKPYYFSGGTIDLSSTVETDFTANGNQVSTFEYFYDYDKHYQVASVKTDNSEGGKTMDRMLYPPSIANPSYAEQKLLDQHQIAEVVTAEKIKLNEQGEQLSQISKHNVYGEFAGSMILPAQLQMFNNSILASEINYSKYDSQGNLLEFNKTGAPSVVYLWSYGGKFPIAEIKNTTYSVVEQVLGGAAIVNSFSESNPTDQQISSVVSTLKGSQMLKDVQITSYTYSPLLGITSETDPKGLTTYFEYDDALRLKHIKDQEGKLLKTYDYHYKD